MANFLPLQDQIISGMEMGKGAAAHGLSSGLKLRRVFTLPPRLHFPFYS